MIRLGHTAVQHLGLPTAVIESAETSEATNDVYEDNLEGKFDSTSFNIDMHHTRMSR